MQARAEQLRKSSEAQQQKSADDFRAALAQDKEQAIDDTKQDLATQVSFARDNSAHRRGKPGEAAAPDGTLFVGRGYGRVQAAPGECLQFLAASHSDQAQPAIRAAHRKRSHGPPKSAFVKPATRYSPASAKPCAAGCWTFLRREPLSGIEVTEFPDLLIRLMFPRRRPTGAPRESV